MKHIRAIYDGQQVVLLEPVDLPPNTPLDVVVLDDAAAEQQVLVTLQAQGLIRTTAPPANTLVPFTPVAVTGPPVSQTVLEERR
jgi:hypothetical protein